MMHGNGFIHIQMLTDFFTRKFVEVISKVYFLINHRGIRGYSEETES